MLAMLLGIFKIIIGLLVVVGLAYYSTHLLSRRLPVAAGRGQVRVMGHLYLGGRRGVSLIRVADTVLVLGVTDHHVTLLDKVADPEKVKAIEDSAAAPLLPGDGMERLREGFRKLFEERLGSLGDRFQRGHSRRGGGGRHEG